MSQKALKESSRTEVNSQVIILYGLVPTSDPFHIIQFDLLFK